MSSELQVGAIISNISGLVGVVVGALLTVWLSPWAAKRVSKVKEQELIKCFYDELETLHNDLARMIKLSWGAYQKIYLLNIAKLISKDDCYPINLPAPLDIYVLDRSYFNLMAALSDNERKGIKSIQVHIQEINRILMPLRAKGTLDEDDSLSAYYGLLWSQCILRKLCKKMCDKRTSFNWFYSSNEALFQATLSELNLSVAPFDIITSWRDSDQKKA